MSEVEELLKNQKRLTPLIVKNIIDITERFNRKGVMIFSSTVKHAEATLTYLPEDEARLVVGDTDISVRDSIVEEVASQMEMTYDDMFSAPPKDATMGTEDEKYGTVVNSPSFMTWQPLSYSNILDANKVINDKLNDKIKNAATSGRDIVVDMTNMTANARKQALKSISGKEDMFHKVAVVFPFHGAEHIIKKMAFKRSQEIKSQGGSKTIPPEVLDRMMSSFQQISPEEGFDEVVEMDNRQKLKELLGNN
jgi:hypothetical protein